MTEAAAKAKLNGLKQQIESGKIDFERDRKTKRNDIDLYDIMGLKPGCSAEDIKNMYDKQSNLIHNNLARPFLFF